MKSKFPPTIQFQFQIKPKKTERATSGKPFWKKFPKPVIGVTIISSLVVLIIYLSALGVLGLSNCGELRVQLNSFELQLVKGSCNAPL